MNNKQTKLYKRLSLFKDMAQIKLSLLGFISWSKSDTRLVAEIVRSVTARFEKLAVTRGRDSAIREMKASRLAFTRWLCGRPLSGNVGAPIAKNGLPKVLPLVVRSALIKDADIGLIKAAITCLSMSRFFKGGSEIDLDAITCGAEPKMPKDSEILLSLRKLGLTPGQDRPSDYKFRGVVSAGPNGPSISSSLQDLPKFNELFRPQVDVILPELLPSIDKLLAGEKAFKFSALLALNKFKDHSLRKLSVKEDKEGKSRVFAIFDYGSQTTLTPLHDGVYSLLRKIPNDCTFDQVKGVAMIQSFKSRKNFYSYDLKSATDRFPVVLQERVLSLLIDKDYAKAGREIMTREPFRLKGVENPIKWGTGQPLGAKSSWAMFTLCHHVVVHLAAIRSNSEAHYVILGDDIVLRGRALAVEYKRIMADLGVEISGQKSHVSKDTFEFAKIWTRRGQNLSGFPIAGLAETLAKPLEMAALFVFECPAKGYHYSIDPRSVSSFFQPVATGNTCPNRKAVGTADKVCWYFSFLSGLLTKDGGGAKYIAQSASLVTSPLIANDLFSQVIKEKWAKQLDKTLSAFWDFGIDLLTRLRGLPPFKPVGDPKSYPGKMNVDGIEFSAPVQHVPIFAALQQESKVIYSDYIQTVLEDEDHKLTLEEIDSLRLPPRAQLKGFEPVRGKENIRTVSLISRGLNQDLMTKATKITADVIILSNASGRLASLGEGRTCPKSLRDVMTPAMSITHSGSLPGVRH